MIRRRALISTLFIFLYICRSYRHQLVRVKPAHNQRLFRLAASSAIAPVSKYSPRREQNSQFDIALAVILAGYAFESYNEPSVGKVAMGLDSTKITFTSADFIRRAFAGVLLLSLNKGTFKADAIEEEQLLEKMVTGADPDPYVSISVVEPGARRVLDAARSSDKANTATPSWRESFLLYVSDPSEASIAFRAMDKDLFKEDDLMGIGSISVDELQANTEISGFGMGGIPVPIYLEDTKSTPASAQSSTNAKKKKMRRSGTLQVDAQFIPWDADKLKPGTEQRAATDRRAAGDQTPLRSILPTGASPGLVDWPSLMETVVDRAKRLRAQDAQTQFDMDDMAEGMLHRASKSPSDSNPGTRSGTIATPSSSGMQEATALAAGTDIAAAVRTRCLTEGVSNGLQPVCSIENTETDTQASVWADFKGKQLVISFRGTEQVKFKDILTDINLIQTSYEATHPALAKTLIHRGFLEAFLSVREALLQLIHKLLTLPPDTKDSNNNGGASVHEGWSIYITGHSLGGALATLMSFELARLQAGLYTLPSSNDAPIQQTTPSGAENGDKAKVESPQNIKGGGWPSINLPFFSNSNNEDNADASGSTEGAAAALASAMSWATGVFNSVAGGSGSGDAVTTVTGTKSDPATVYMQDEAFKKELEKSQLTMYTFGAPRTGDPQFAELFDQLVPRGFRIVNNQDIVARIPRAAKANRLLEYEHVGRTVMIDDAALGLLWVQGESPGECPVADISPFVDASKYALTNADDATAGSPTAIAPASGTMTSPVPLSLPVSEKDIAEIQGKVTEAMASVTDQLNEATSALTDQYESGLQQLFTAANNLSAVGIDTLDTFTKGFSQLPTLPTFPFGSPKPQDAVAKRVEGTKVSLSFSVDNTEFSTQLGGEIVIPSMEQLAQTGSEYLSNSTALLADSLSQYIAANLSVPLSQGLTDTANQYLAAFNSSTESLKSMTDSFSQQLFQSFGQIQSLVGGPTAAAAATAPATTPALPSTGRGVSMSGPGSLSTDTQGMLPSLPMSLVIPSSPVQLIEVALSATGLSTEDVSQLLSVGQSLGDVAADVSRGIEDRFIEREMEMLSAILSGKALEHHLEPSYFIGLQKAVEAAAVGEQGRRQKA